MIIFFGISRPNADCKKPGSLDVPAHYECGDWDDQQDPEDDPHYDGGEGEGGEVQDSWSIASHILRK
jgi:hypothetical protein